MTEGDTQVAELGNEDESRITSDDLHARFGRLTGESDDSPAPIERPGIALLGLVVVGAMVVAFALGRRAGRKKSTFVEIVRI